MTDQKAPGLRLTQQEDELLNLLFNAMFVNGRVNSQTVNEQLPLAVFDLLNQVHCRDLVVQLKRIVDLETQLDQSRREAVSLRVLVDSIETKMNMKHHTYKCFKDWFYQQVELLNAKFTRDEEVQAEQ